MVFFTLVSVGIVIVASLQTSIAMALDDQCDATLVTAPSLAAVCLFSSFVCTGAWLGAKSRRAKTAERLAIFLWTTVLSVGLVSVGAAMGQAQVYDSACPSLNSDMDFNVLGIASTILLVLSVAAPHARDKGGDLGTLSRSDTTDFYTGGDEQSKKPLIFI
jgi:hypothetical protein